MAVQLTLLGWKASGIRCPDHEVELTKTAGVAWPISLIQMPNGTGKTTTLELLRAALSGSTAEWDGTKVRSFKKREGDTHQGSFVVHLTYDGHKLTFALTFDFDDGSVQSTTTSGAGMRNGYKPPPEVRRFLRKGFVDFFVFDGELAQRLLDSRSTNAQTAIEDLFQLDLFKKIRTEVDEYWVQATGSLSATEEKAFVRRRNRVMGLQARLTAQRSARQEINDQLLLLVKERNEKKNHYEADLADRDKLDKSWELATARLNEAQAGVDTAARQVVSIMRDPHAVSATFAAEMADLKESLDRVKLPESTARQFFEELVEEDTCVCGRDLDEGTRNAIRERASHYLGSEDVILLNAMKKDIWDQIGSDPTVPEAEMKNQLSHLETSRRKLLDARDERLEIENSRILDDPVLTQAKAEIEALTKEIVKLENERDEVDNPHDVRPELVTTSIPVLTRYLDEATKKLDEIRNTIKLRSKRDILFSILDEAHRDAKKGIGTEIAAEANDRIADLMPYNDIRIKDINRCLVLEGREGGSTGETLSVAYAFLATLFNRTDHHLPFVVDSPAGPIDLAIRPTIAELVPRLGHQFVAFTISSERNGFLPSLERVAEDDIQYLTLFWKGATNLEEQAASELNVVRTDDGICVTGRTFFNNFHVQSEENSDAV